MSDSSDAEPVSSCAGCGASIYQEHIDRNLAGLLSGDLYCPHCLTAKRQADSAMGSGQDIESLSLVDEPGSDDQAGRSSIHGFSGFSVPDAMGAEKEEFQRQLNLTGKGATRIRIFHSKISEGAVRHLNEQINEWLDANPDIEIKFANTTVGMWEGKHSEPNLLLMLFY